MSKKTYSKPAIESTFMHQELMNVNTNASTSTSTDNCPPVCNNDGPSGCSSDHGCKDDETEYGKKGHSVWSVWDD